MGYIYKVTNTINGKAYIGQTRRTVGKRWTDHKARYRNDKSCSLLYMAMRKYGHEVFSAEEVEQCPDELLNEREIYWIAKLNTVRNGYNISKGGLGYVHEGVPVVQFDLDGNYIQTFESVPEAAKAMNCAPQRIYAVCEKTRRDKSWKGYQWRYADDCDNIGKVKPLPKATPVYQYTMDGEYVASFDSIYSATKQFDGMRGTGGIRGVCTGRNRHSHGYRWSYEKVDKLPPIRKSGNDHPVEMFDRDGNFIKSFPTITDASRETGIGLCAISAVCNNRYKTAGGYKWARSEKAS